MGLTTVSKGGMIINMQGLVIVFKDSEMLIGQTSDNIIAFKQSKESKMAITPEQLENWFTYHSPTADDQVGYLAIREAGKHLAEMIVTHTPASADQTAAIRKVREAVMTANAAIACKGL